MVDALDRMPVKHKELITDIANKVYSEQEGIEVYLFGSYARGRVRRTSDVDLLVLFIEDVTREELKHSRRRLTDVVEEHFNYEIEVDIKVYNKGDFNLSSNKLGFENEISKYKIRLNKEV